MSRPSGDRGQRDAGRPDPHPRDLPQPDPQPAEDQTLDEPGPDNPRICHCWHVQLRRIEAAIDAGATTVQAIGAVTRAGTGCGTCRFDLEELLEARAGGKRPDPS